MGTSPDESPIRLAELVASLSLGIDLGFGQPMEHVLRQCLIALRIAELLGLSEAERVNVYYSGLLVNVGCHTDAHEQAKWFGDDIAMKATKYKESSSAVAEAASMLRLVGSGSTPVHRFRVGLELAVSGRKQVAGMIARHAALARELGEYLHLPDGVLDALGSSYERWDGKGWPGKLGGNAIPIASRVVQVAEYVEVAHRVDGTHGAVAMAKRRSDKQFDPAIVDTLTHDAEKIFDHLDDASSWDTVINSEPSLAIGLTDDECDSALLAISRFVDLKSPYTLGHSLAVSELAGAAAVAAGFTAAEVREVRRAGLVAGFGRLGVSNAIWDKPGALGAGEWERVRLHPYLSQRMLQQSPTLAPLARIAVQLRELLDGSGYPLGLTGTAIGPLARVLGAADAYQAMREPRPHRDARTSADAAAELQADVRAGRRDAGTVDAVLTAAGHRVERRRDGLAGLTPREVDVLRLVARGRSNKEIAADLVISPKTAGNHIEHIYTKIGTTSRAAAGLFAMRNGLLPENG